MTPPTWDHDYPGDPDPLLDQVAPVSEVAPVAPVAPVRTSANHVFTLPAKGRGNGGRSGVNGKHTDATGPKKTKDAIPRAPDGPARAAMLDLVARMQRTDGTIPQWRAPFELARTLKGIPQAEVMDMEPVVREFSDLTGMDPVDTVGRFVDAWDAVTSPVGSDTWTDCVRLAEAGIPTSMTPSPGITFGLLARVCYHLSVATGGRPFPVPVKLVARLYGVTTQAASKAIRALVRLRVIEVADGSYSYTQGKAKTYRFVARVTPRTDP